MAKKQTLKTDGPDFDADLNFDDWGLDDIEGSKSPEVDSPKRKAVMDAFTGTVQGAVDKFTDPSTLAAVTKEALPKQYGEIFSKADEITTGVASLYNDAARAIKPTMTQVVRQVDKLVPQESKRLRPFVEKLRELVGDTEGYGMSQAQREEETINNSLAAVFAAQSEQDATERAQDKAEEHIQQAVDAKRFKTEATILSSIDTNVSRFTQYNDKVNQAYQKKSLELQFRGYFLQQELVASTKRYFEIFKTQNDSVIKNTALPEFVKITKAEQFKQQASQKFFNNISSGLFGDGEFIRKGFANIRKDMMEKVSEFKDAVEMGLMGVDMVSGLTGPEDEFSPGKASLAGNFAGGLGATYALNKGAMRLRKYFDESDSDMAKKVKEYGFKGATIAANLPGAMRDLRNSSALEENFEDGPVKDTVKGFGRWVLDSFLSGQRVDKDLAAQSGIGNLAGPAIFDNKVHKSIVEVIPGYLARIFQELQIARTGNEKLGLSQFDYESGKFSTRKEIAGNIDKALRASGRTDSYVYSLERAKGLVTGGLDVDKHSMLAIEEIIRDMAFDNKSYKPSDIPNHSKFNDIQKRYRPAIRRKLKEMYGDDVDPVKRSENEYNFTKSMGQVKNSVGDMRGKIEMYRNAGYGDILRELGILETKGGVDSINMDVYKDYTLSEAQRKIVEDDRNLTHIIRNDGQVRPGSVKSWDTESNDLNTKPVTDRLDKMLEALKTIAENTEGSDGTAVSDINAKTRIQDFSPKAALDNIKNLGIFKWFYKPGKGDQQEHTGPMAQDVRRVMGEDAAPGGTKIDLVNLNGNNMAAIEALRQEQEAIKSELNGNTVNQKPSDTLSAIKTDTAEIIDLLSKKGITISAFPSIEFSNDGLAKMATAFSGFAGRSKDKLNDYVKAVRQKLSGNDDSDADSDPGDENDRRALKGMIGKYFGRFGERVAGGISSVTKRAKGIGTSLFRTGKDAASATKDFITEQYNDKKEPTKKLVGELFTKSVKLAGTVIGKTSDLLTKTLPAGIKQLKDLGVTLKNKALDLLDQPTDIYVVGKPMPVMQAVVMKMGLYYDYASKTPITKPSQIKGAVVDKDGNFVLTQADFEQGVIDKDGNPIESPMKKLIGMGVGAVARGMSFANNAVRGLIDAGKGGGKQILTGLKGMFEKFMPKSFGFNITKSYQVLVEIRNILDKRLPGGQWSSEERPGNWRDRLEEQETETNTKPQEPAQTAPVQPQYQSSTNVVDSMMGAAGSLFSKGKSFLQDRAVPAATTAAQTATTSIGTATTAGKGFFGRMAAKGKGLLSTGLNVAGNLLGGGNSPQDNQPQDQSNNPNQPSTVDSVKDKASELTGKTKSLLSNLFNKGKEKVKAIPESFRKFNDKDGSGKRDGDAQDRLEEQERRKAERQAEVDAERQQSESSLGMRYKGTKNILDVIAEKAKAAFGSIRDGLSGLSDVVDIGGGQGGGKGGAPGTVGEAAKTAGKGGFWNKAKGFGGTALKAGGGALAAMGLGYAADKARESGHDTTAGVLDTAGTAAGVYGAFQTVAGVSGLLAGTGGVTGAIGTAGVAATGAIGTAAATVLGGIASVLASPVVIGAAVTAGLAYGGYKAYKYFTRNKASVLDEWRMAQYGFGKESKDFYHYVYELEGYLSDDVKGFKEGKAYLIEKNLDVKRVLEIFDVSLKDKEATNKLVYWFNNRFKPVYLNHLTVLYSVAPKLRLDEVNDLDDQQKVTYVNKAEFKDGPYTVMTSPLKELPQLTAGPAQVSEAFEHTKKTVDKNTKLKGSEIDPKIAVAATGAVVLTESKLKGEDASVVQTPKAPETKMDWLKRMATATVAGQAAVYTMELGGQLMKSFGFSPSALESIRFKLYGFKTISASDVRLIRMLESHFASNSLVTNDLKVTFNIDANKLVTLIGSQFGVSSLTTDPKAKSWMKWINNRFTPVFTAYLGNAFGMVKKTDPEAIETALSDNQRYELAIKVSGVNGIWEITDGPYEDQPVNNDSKSIAEHMNFLKAKYKPQPLPEQKATEQKLQPAKPPVPEKVEEVLTPKSQGTLDKGESFVQNGESEEKIAKQVAAEPKPSAGTSIGTGGSNSNIPLAQGPLKDGSAGMQYIKPADPSVKLDGINPALMKNLAGMAQEYGEATGQSIVLNSAWRDRKKQEALYNADPSKAARPGKSPHEFGLALDVNTDTLNKLEEMGLMRKYGFTRPIGGEGWHAEPAGIQVNVQKAKEDPDFASQAIEASVMRGGGGAWNAPGTPKGKRDQDVALAALDLKASSKAKEREPDKSVVTKALEPAKPATSSTAIGTGPATTTAKAEPAKPSSDKQAIGTGPTTSSTLTPKPETTATAKAPMTLSQAMDKAEAKSASNNIESEPGKLGKVAAVPEVKASSPEEVKQGIAKVAQAAGAKPEVLQTFAAVESSMNPQAKAKGTTATGLYQFLKGTWDEIVGKKGSKYGIDPSTPPTDIKASTLMASEYIKDNARAISSVKPDPTTTDLYLAHFLGPGGARKMLAANPDAAAASVVPDAAKSNGSMFYENGRTLTVSEFYNKVLNKLKKAASGFGINVSDGELATKQSKTVAGTVSGTVSDRPKDTTVTEKKGPVSIGTAPIPKTAEPSQTQTPVAKSTPAPSVVSTPPASILSKTDQSSQPATVPGILGSAKTKPLDEGKPTNIAGQPETMGIILNESLSVQKQTLDVLKSILKSIGNTQPSAPSSSTPAPSVAQQPAPVANTQPTPAPETKTPPPKVFGPPSAPVGQPGVSLKRVMV